MHDDVVGAVYRVLVTEQGEDLAERAGDRVLGVRLVPPERGPPISYPPTADAVTAGTAIPPVGSSGAPGARRGRLFSRLFWRLGRRPGVDPRGAVAAIAAAGSSGPISVSRTAVPFRAPEPRPGGTLAIRLSKAACRNRPSARLRHPQVP